METIDYNKLTEHSKIKVKIGEVDKEFDITTEATLTHGHGMPGEYGFDLSDKEKSIVKWLVEKFKIEDYKQIVDSFFEENGLNSSNLNGFISGISYLKLRTKTAEEESGFPDLTLSGKYGEIDFTLNFRKKKLVQIINQRRLKYNDKNQVVEIQHYGITGNAGYRETFKYNDAGRKIEECQYHSNGELYQITKYNDKGVRIEYRHYEDGKLLSKQISDDNGRMLEQYSNYSKRESYHYFYTRDVDGALIESNKYTIDEKLVLKAVYDQDGHTSYFYNEKDGRLEKVCKFDKEDNLIDETTYNPDGSVEYETSNSLKITAKANNVDRKTPSEAQPKQNTEEDKDNQTQVRNRDINIGPKTYAVYNGCLSEYVSHDKKKGLIYILFHDEEEGKASGIKPEIDRSEKYPSALYRGAVPESEVTDIYEVHKGQVMFFPVTPQKIVFLKENGVWHNDEDPVLDEDEENVGFKPLKVDYQQSSLYNSSIEQLEAEAAKGNCLAQMTLGRYYEFGSNVKQSYEKAFKYFKLAAERGEYFSQNCVGYYYSQGLGVEQDDKEAFKWFSESALYGNTRALCNVARCYRLGIGVDQDLEKAVEYYKKLGDMGNVIYGYRNLAHIHYSKKEYTKAIIYWSLAAENNDVESNYNLGVLCFYGKVRPVNYSKAVSHFKRAMQMGNRQSEFMLGYCYKEGLGVTQDLNTAEQLWQDAAENGNKEAIVELKKMKGSSRKKNPGATSGNNIKCEYDICFEDQFIGY
ncbi:MAG: sel1 repeat family protein [Paludibacteraceae bacterium]|nr:sel1 repeat family protein [Paludibacteraceae bacterium]